MSEKKTDNEFSTGEVSAKVIFEDQDTVRRLCGPNDKHLRLLKRKLGVQMSMRGDELSIKG
ncbi:MAG: phosphate starvation-inducible protein PhoH, partial [Myxococcota bacterium]